MRTHNVREVLEAMCDGDISSTTVSRVAQELLADLAGVFAPEERKECLRCRDEMAGQWEGRYPAVAKMLREGLEDCLSVLDFPEHHRRRLQSTNMLENLMKRLKKRSRVVGVFPSRSSCDRLLGAQLIEVHEEWSVEENPYFNMENVDLDAVPARVRAVA